MVAERRLRDGHIEPSARELSSVPERSNDLQPNRIAQCVQHIREARLLPDWVRYLPHRGRTNVRRISNKHTNGRSPDWLAREILRSTRQQTQAASLASDSAPVSVGHGNETVIPRIQYLSALAQKFADVFGLGGLGSR